MAALTLKPKPLEPVMQAREITRLHRFQCLVRSAIQTAETKTAHLAGPDDPVGEFHWVDEPVKPFPAGWALAMHPMGLRGPTYHHSLQSNLQARWLHRLQQHHSPNSRACFAW
jgi:hypothetical protein